VAGFGPSLDAWASPPRRSGHSRTVSLLAKGALCAVLGLVGGLFVVAPASGLPAVPAAALRTYVAQIEKVRLPVNRLLEQADPILDAYSAGTITPEKAGDEMGDLEERFAHYLLIVQLIQPANGQLAKLNKPYAHTYYLEDSYLATLASDLDDGGFDNLPDTQDAQRLAIIVWRTQLEILATRDGVHLPADLQQAGRGEIAPAIGGS
jgi:hypothetical protein